MNIKRKGIYPSALFLLLISYKTFSANATSPSPGKQAKLVEVYLAAMNNDAKLAGYRHAFSAEAEAVPQAKAALLPSLTAGINTESNSLTRETPNLSRRRNSSFFQANLSQPLFRIDRWYQLQVAINTVSQAELDLTYKEQEVIVTAAESYLEVLRQLDSLAAAKAEVDALKQQRDQAQGRLDDGAASITDVLDAQAAFDEASANRQLIEKKVDDAFEGLQKLTNETYNSISGISHQLPISAPVPLNSAIWVDRATTSNFKLLASKKNVESAAGNVKVKKSGYAPTVDIVATYKRGDNDSFGYSNPTDYGTNGYGGRVSETSIGVQVNIPIYSGGMTRSEVRESVERFSQSEDELEDLRREIVLNTRNYYRAVITDLRQVDARRQSIISSLKSVEANKVGMTIGSRNITNVLEAQRLLYRTVRDYNDARYDFILDTLKLKQLSGSLSPEDLTQLGEYSKSDYDPDIDYLPFKLIAQLGNTNANFQDPKYR